MPFSNLPDTRKSRWGDELTAVFGCVPAVAQIEFLEWTTADRFRHAKFVGLRDDKDPRSVVKEHPGACLECSCLKVQDGMRFTTLSFRAGRPGSNHTGILFAEQYIRSPGTGRTPSLRSRHQGHL